MYHPANDTLVLMKNQLSPTLFAIAAKVIHGKRITDEEGLILYQEAPLSYLGWLSTLVREQKSDKKAYYVKNFHVEPTNICRFDCLFCSYKSKTKQDAWLYSIPEIVDSVKAQLEKGITEVHVVGAVHPQWPIEHYAAIIKAIKEVAPQVHVKAYSAVELHHMFKQAGYSAAQGFELLKAHGLDAIPGGGAEIFDTEIRQQICPDKVSTQGWLEIHKAAHQAGIPSNATMLYGHIESYAHRIDHMRQLRELQDQTQGFKAFIPLKFKNKNNKMSAIDEVSVLEDLKNYAVSRIYLDNFPHLKAYWPMIGKSTTQLALSFGVDDVDGTIDDSTKIYAVAGAEDQHPSMSSAALQALVKEAGYIPVERDALYQLIA